MRGPRDMALAFETVLTDSAANPASIPPSQPTTDCLNVTVLFTSVEATLTALREAGRLAHSLNGRITLVVPQIVPFPLPLTSPPVLLEWNERRFRVMANDSPVETKVALYLCRDRLRTLQAVLAPRSLVVLSGPRHWWPTTESRIARKLRRAGHEVIFKELEKQC